jgi:predicted nucleic acid-binding protein
VIVLDASVLVAFFASADTHHDLAAQILRAHADQEWGASVITVAELLVGPARSGPIEVAKANNALARLGIAELALPPNPTEGLAHLRVSTGLKLPDCVVLLTAERHAAPIATFDARLATVAHRRGIASIEAIPAPHRSGPQENPDDAAAPRG